MVAVFGIDISLVFHQPFTRVADDIRSGIVRAGGRGTVAAGNARSQSSQSAEQLIRATNALNQQTGNAGPGGAPAGIGGAASDAQFATIQRRMAESFQALERDEQGYATANALMAVVSAMRAIPGRKSVVFFTEGLAIPPNVKARFESVIDAANRANVSIYPMDAAGLRTLSTTKETNDGVTEASNITLARDPTRDVTDRPMMAALEKNEDLLRADPHSGLDQLADQTGGFLIANTNDLRAGFGRIDTDMRNYYVLTYVPSNTSFDGKFRTIDVKVKRGDVRVSSRKGYYALRAPSGAPVLGFEAPALAVLDRTPVPNAFPARAMALRFPEPDRPGLSPVVVTVATSGVTFREVPDRKIYSSDFIVLVRFKDSAGTVFEKMSQRYQLQGPIDQLATAKVGEVLFYREPDAPAGRLLDGDRGLRRARGEGHRPVRHRGRAGRQHRVTAHEQHRRRAAGGEGARGRARARQPALRGRSAADAQHGRAAQQGRQQGAAFLLHRLPGEGAGRDDSDALAAELGQGAR